MFDSLFTVCSRVKPLPRPYDLFSIRVRVRLCVLRLRKYIDRPIRYGFIDYTIVPVRVPVSVLRFGIRVAVLL